LEEKENAAGKGRPTPSRKEQEKLRKKPLVGDKSKEAKRIEKERVREQRAKIREGMMSGDERYLTSRDRGPQRKLVETWLTLDSQLGSWSYPHWWLWF